MQGRSGLPVGRASTQPSPGPLTTARLRNSNQPSDHWPPGLSAHALLRCLCSLLAAFPRTIAAASNLPASSRALSAGGVRAGGFARMIWWPAPVLNARSLSCPFDRMVRSLTNGPERFRLGTIQLWGLLGSWQRTSMIGSWTSVGLLSS